MEYKLKEKDKTNTKPKMDVPDDNTAVLQMKRDFDAFISQGSSHNAGNMSKRAKMSFENSSLMDVTENSHPVSMQKLLERDREEKQRQAELIKARSVIAQLRNDLASAERSRQLARVEQEKKMEDARLEVKREQEKSREVKQKFHRLMEKEVEAREELRACQKELDTCKANYEQKLMVLQRDKIRLENEKQEDEQTSYAKILELKNEKMRQDTELQICRSELEQTKTLLQNALRRCSETSKQLSELEEYRVKAVTAEHRVKELELQLARSDEDSTVARTMKSQLSRLPELERENRKLREENKYCKDTQENTYLLHEEVSSLKKKLERYEQRCEEYEHNKLLNQELQKKLQQWQTVSPDRRIQSPSSLKFQLSELQKSNAILLEKQGQLQASLHSTELSMKTFQQQLVSANEGLFTEQEKNKQCADLIKRLQRKLLLVTKERESYKKMMECYENKPNVDVPAALHGRIHELEEVTSRYHRQMVTVESDLEQAQGLLSDAHTRIFQLEHQPMSQGDSTFPDTATCSEVDQKIIGDLRQQVANLQKELETVQEQKEVLEARIEQRHLQGDYDPSTTKVIHLLHNPVWVAQQKRAEQVSSLTKERDSLAERIKLLEEGGPSPDNLTVLVEERLKQPSSSKEVEEMRTALQGAELKNKRLMEAFKKTSQEIREVCYQLLGYRIDIRTANQYRLMNMYADSPDDFLLFQQNSSGNLELLATDYSANLEDKIDTYLLGSNSIPAFLSSITLDLFQRQTIMS